MLKVPDGQVAHVPADAPPQPLKYWPAAQKEALHVEQAEAPEGKETNQAR